MLATPYSLLLRSEHPYNSGTTITKFIRRPGVAALRIIVDPLTRLVASSSDSLTFFTDRECEKQVLQIRGNVAPHQLTTVCSTEDLFIRFESTRHEETAWGFAVTVIPLYGIDADAMASLESRSQAGRRRSTALGTSEEAGGLSQDAVLVLADIARNGSRWTREFALSALCNASCKAAALVAAIPVLDLLKSVFSSSVTENNNWVKCIAARTLANLVDSKSSDMIVRSGVIASLAQLVAEAEPSSKQAILPSLITALKNFGDESWDLSKPAAVLRSASLTEDDDLGASSTSAINAIRTLIPILDRCLSEASAAASCARD